MTISSATSDTSALPATAVAALRRDVRGRLLFPADLAYPAAVTGHNLAVSHAPALVVEPACAEDVVAAVRTAAAHDLPVLTQLTGHGATHAQRGGVLLRTDALDQLVVDGDRLRVGAGIRWREAVAAAAAHGLAPVCANALDLGVVGFALGGGIGPLGRRYGYAADHVRSLEVVTPDGHHRHVDATRHPDLFWALRGGKVGLGIVTSVELDLVPAPHVRGGTVVVDGSTAGVALRGFVAGCERLDDDATATATVLRAPDLPQVPEPLRGRHLVQVTVADLGTTGSGVALLDAVAASAPTLMRHDADGDLDGYLTHHGDGGPAMPTWQRGRLTRPLDADAATVLADALDPRHARPLLAVQLRQLGGALDRPVDNAVGGRGAAFLLNVLGAPDPALFDGAVPAAADAVLGAMAPWLDGRSQANFHGPVDAEHPLDLAWDDATAARLAIVRQDVAARLS